MANVEAFGPVRIALVAASIDEARRVMIEGESGLIRVGAPLVRRWFSTEGRIVFNSGAEAQIYSGASPDRLRGPEHHFAWCDELSKWRQAEKSWDMLQLGLRLGEKPRAVITTTPRPGPALERIMADPKVVTTGGTTRANPHLPASFVRAVHAMYGGTRLGRQELDGEMLTDAPGALWTVETLEKSRLRGARPGQFERVAVGVDPPSGDGTCGIVVCARDRDGVGHVLADHSVAGVSPDAWARTVAGAAAIHRAELIVAERNQGGRMVGHVLQVADPGARVKLVNATQGKCVRAEPIGLLFEAGRIRIHGEFPELEAQLKGMIAGGGYEGPGTSPDRADAMIWALIELMLGHGAKPELRSI
jgi:phage terminase large subunit-like protein